LPALTPTIPRRAEGWGRGAASTLLPDSACWEVIIAATIVDAFVVARMPPGPPFQIRQMGRGIPHAGDARSKMAERSSSETHCFCSQGLSLRCPRRPVAPQDCWARKGSDRHRCSMQLRAQPMSVPARHAVPPHACFHPAQARRGLAAHGSSPALRAASHNGAATVAAPDADTQVGCAVCCCRPPSAVAIHDIYCKPADTRHCTHVNPLCVGEQARFAVLHKRFTAGRWRSCRAAACCHGAVMLCAMMSLAAMKRAQVRAGLQPGASSTLSFQP